ncbi:MAG: hypothetical protein E6R04_03305 [Spirochaetes bacterium]|nr:MAG: hypothetical protein E6R04_03305 [Spirochaetota bacterium]
MEPRLELHTFSIPCGGWARWGMPPRARYGEAHSKAMSAASWLSERLPVSRALPQGASFRASDVYELMISEKEMGRLTFKEFTAAACRSGHHSPGDILNKGTPLSIPPMAFEWYVAHLSRKEMTVRNQTHRWLEPFIPTRDNLHHAFAEMKVAVKEVSEDSLDMVEYTMRLLTEKYPSVLIPKDSRCVMTIADVRQNLERSEGRCIPSLEFVAAAKLAGYNLALDPSGLSGLIGVNRRIGGMLTARSHRSADIRELRRRSKS